VPIELITIPEKGLAVLTLPDPGRRVLRLLFQYQYEFRAMAWMQIGADGSVYLNPRRKPTGPGVHAEAVADGTGGISELIFAAVEPGDMSNPKVSHHASGLVKAGSRRSMSVAVRNVREPTLVRKQDFSHPSRFEVIKQEAMRETDIVVPWHTGEPYELFDDKPLTSRMWIAPFSSGEAKVAVVDDILDARRGQTAIVVPAQRLTGCQDFTCQVLFFSQSGKWPDHDWIETLKINEAPVAADQAPVRPEP